MDTLKFLTDELNIPKLTNELQDIRSFALYHSVIIYGNLVVIKFKRERKFSIVDIQRLQVQISDCLSHQFPTDHHIYHTNLSPLVDMSNKRIEYHFILKDKKDK